MTWLAETPSGVVQACVTMLSRLEAQESVLAANRAAMGSGLLPEQVSTDIARGWEETAQLRPEPRMPAPKGKHLDVLVAHGFAVKRVPATRKAS